MRPRDSQRSRMYKAEWATSLENLRTTMEPQAYIDAILLQSWFKQQFPHVRHRKPTIVLRGFRSTGGQQRGNWLEINKNYAHSPMVLLHELAHWIEYLRDRWVGARLVRPAAHGREFAADFLFLVRNVLGEKAAEELRDSFVEHRVMHKPKRQLSPEALAKARERGKALAALRQQRRLP